MIYELPFSDYEKVRPLFREQWDHPVIHSIIDECLANGITPHWKTEKFRVDSIRIAEKLGFEKKREYRCFYFPMRKVETVD